MKQSHCNLTFLKMRDKAEEETLSSPSHEFSFTISLHHHHKSPTPPQAAVDLSPADDIFFHGHLLPLQLLSHLPSSPRSSTNSIDSFTLPIKDFLRESTPEKITNYPRPQRPNEITDSTQPHRPNSKHTKSFSLFRWKNNKDNGDEEKQKGKIINILKRYMRMVSPVLSSFRREKVRVRRQPCTFSGNLMRSGYSYNNNNIKCGFSAPASMRSSPYNSGLLVENGVVLGTCNANDSTMEELQSAIQAAIAHCKSSIATEDNSKRKI